MGIGGCVALIAAGAILAFAANWHFPGVNIHVAGVVMMIAGVIGLMAFMGIYRRRLPPPPPDEHRHGDHPGSFIEERRYYD
ncbi:hypothetical protein [Phaeacidiphilus oryzae]|jgi:membrane protein implicated in regulation of membrane protease activity|uniref:hypothetical protein n=1 Tax=Phaeacidiphilus oryzae TaxID=348818 RepID=UPI000692060D|nr:hypothetical protein [Phaeacidiphilus oryzae]